MIIGLRGSRFSFESSDLCLKTFQDCRRRQRQVNTIMGWGESPWTIRNPNTTG